MVLSNTEAKSAQATAPTSQAKPSLRAKQKPSQVPVSRGVQMVLVLSALCRFGRVRLDVRPRQYRYLI
jgi:hypothetical protein